MYFWKLIKFAYKHNHLIKSGGFITFERTPTRNGTNPWFTTCCIWSCRPAVMFDIVHVASFWMFVLGLVNRLGKTASAPASITTCVCSSVPVTMFPMALRAGVWNGKKWRQSPLQHFYSSKAHDAPKQAPFHCINLVFFVVCVLTVNNLPQSATH